MWVALLFFLVSSLFGYALVKLLKLEASPLVVLSTSVLLGTVATALLFFFTAWVVPVSQMSLVIELVVLAGVSIYFLKNNLAAFQKSLWEGIWKLFSCSHREKLLGLFFIVLVVWLFGRSLFFDNKGQLFAGDRLVWTDWPVHMAIAASFAWGHNFPPQNPTFAGIPLIYPFFSDFVSGLLLALGASLPQAFIVPGMVLTLAFFGLYVAVGSRLLKASKLFKDLLALKLTAMGALFLSLFWGGLGWVYWLAEAFTNETTLVETLLAPAREYTFWWDKGLWFFTFLYSEILPQRGFLFGLPMFFLVLLLVYEGWQKRRLSNFVIAGFLSGLMPFFHTHSYLSLVILAITLGSIGAIGLIKGDKAYKKKYLEAVFLFFLPFSVLSLIQLPLFLPQSQGFPWRFGWMKEGENFFLFWFKNTGFFWPLFILGFWKGKFSGFVKALGIASSALFILPNLFQFAPWGYDNLKIFTYWYLIGAPFVMVGLFWIWRIRLIGPLCASLLFLSLTLSGVVEVGRITDTENVRVGLWVREDQEFAELIRQKTSPEAVFLTAAIHDHPVVSLAGRKILLGFPGNSWSWGIRDWYEREQDVHVMFRGGEAASELWKKYGIDYIVVGSRERGFERNLDEGFIAQNGELVLEKGTTKVYKVK